MRRLVLLLDRRFATLWLSRTISRLGDAIFSIGLPWLVLTTTGSALAVGLALALQMIPALLFGVLVGVIVDRYSRKAVIVICDLLRGLVLGLIVLLHHAGHLGVTHIYVVMFTASAITVFANAANGAILPLILDREQLTKGNSLLSLSREMSDILGKASAGGVIIGLGTIHTFTLNALSFWVSAMLMLVLPLAGQGIPRRASSLRADAREGLLLLRASPLVSAMIGYITAVNVAVSVLAVGLPVYVRDVLGQGAVGYGFVDACMGLGAAAMALGAVRLFRNRQEATVVSGASIAFGVVVAVLPLIPFMAGAGAIMFGAGALATLVVIYQNSVIQKQVPTELLGRVFALQAMTLRTAPAAVIMSAGLLISAVGLRTTFLLAGLVSSLLSLALYRLLLKERAAPAPALPHD
jgi:MFS transporter, DHA3 family, macrolide efflux protein